MGIEEGGWLKVDSCLRCILQRIPCKTEPNKNKIQLNYEIILIKRGMVVVVEETKRKKALYSTALLLSTGHSDKKSMGIE